MFGSVSRCRFLISLRLSLLIAVATYYILVDAQQPGPCIFGHVPDQTVWLNGNLTIKFIANGCEVIALYRNGQPVFQPHPTSSGEMHIFHVSSITEEFNNATMTLQGRHYGENRLLNSTEFKVYTVDNVSAVTNLSYSSNCTYTNVWWLPPYSQGLKVTDYYYELRLNGTIVDSGVTVDPCVVFNLTTLPANEPGYSVSVWACAPPGNGTVTNASIVAALAPNVSYDSIEVIIASQKQKAILVFVGVVDQSCPASHPTGANISFSCLLDKHSVRPVVNGTTLEIYSDAIDTGYTNCSVTVTSINLSGENTSQSFMFSSADVQRLVVRPSNITGAIDVWIKLASNSSLQPKEIVVNIFDSHGILVNSTTPNRSLQERVFTATTVVLPIGWYTVSVLSCYNKSLTINETVNITRSNYSTPSPTPSPSPSPSSSPAPSTSPVPSSTGVPIPTNNNRGIIIGVSIGAVVILLLLLVLLVIFIIVIARFCFNRRKRRKGSYDVPSHSRSTGPRSNNRSSSKPVQAEADRHNNKNSAMVSSGGSVTRPRPISPGKFTSSLPSSPADQYLSTQYEASTPDMQLPVISNNSFPVPSANSTSQTTFTEESSDQPLINPSHYSSYTPPPSLPPVGSMPAVPQRPVEETTTTADSEQHLIPLELSYQAEGIQESR